MLDKPNSKKYKTFQILFDIHATSSLLVLELLHKDLKGYKRSNIKSKWRKGMGEFISEGTVKVKNISFPLFMTQHHLDIEFNLLPKQQDYSYHAIIGMKDLK